MHASFKHCCFFVFLVIFLILSFITISIIFILKPRLPLFSLQTLRLDSYKLETFHSSSVLYVSSVASLFLNAQNPNKFGLGYEPSKLHLFHQGVQIGTIRLPSFYQPPYKEENVSFRARVFLDSVNVSKIMEGNHGGMKLFGNVLAYVKISDVRLPSVKVGLECGIGIDYDEIKVVMNMLSLASVSDDNHRSKYEVGNLFKNSEPMFKNCSFALYL